MAALVGPRAQTRAVTGTIAIRPSGGLSRPRALPKPQDKWQEVVVGGAGSAVGKQMVWEQVAVGQEGHALGGMHRGQVVEGQMAKANVWGERGRDQAA